MPKVELSDKERQPCEVWSRVMGYHRPVDSFNKGKKSEYYERVCFKEEKLAHYLHQNPTSSSEVTA